MAPQMCLQKYLQGAQILHKILIEINSNDSTQIRTNDSTQNKINDSTQIRTNNSTQIITNEFNKIDNLKNELIECIKEANNLFYSMCNNNNFCPYIKNTIIPEEELHDTITVITKMKTCNTMNEIMNLSINQLHSIFFHNMDLIEQNEWTTLSNKLNVLNDFNNYESNKEIISSHIKKIIENEKTNK